MSLESVKEYILSEISQFDIVDAHEHLAPERERVKMKVDVCTLFSHYTRNDFISAGMSPEEYRRMLDTSIPLEQRFSLLEKYLPYIRYGSYARAAFIALRDIYGFKDITRENYREISERMAEFNKPGIYREILVKRCRIKAALTQAGRTDYDEEYLIPVLPLDYVARVSNREEVAERGERLGFTIRSLEDYVSWIRAQLEKWQKEERVVGLKTVSLHRRPAPSPRRAEIAFNAVLRGNPTPDDLELLNLYLMEETFKICGELGLVVAVHSGVWGDFRRTDPRHMIPVFTKFPETTFDLYHMGMPWVRDTAIIGKNNPNVYLNLCWSHIVSPYMVRTSLPEYIDLVPVNKIIGFGADYNTSAVEKVWGHLTIARENIAYALARLVTDRRMTRQEAVEIARLWFLENPARAYNLKI